MKLFLDTSVILSASASSKGASNWIVEVFSRYHWELVSADYCRAETVKNLEKMGGTSRSVFDSLVNPAILWKPDTWVSDYPLLFPKAKDRPVVLAALSARADFLLTLDRHDFQGLLGNQVYNVSIRTPGDFLMEMRNSNAI
jgi:predicted nucleic acid-binding protein